MGLEVKGGDGRVLFKIVLLLITSCIVEKIPSLDPAEQGSKAVGVLNKQTGGDVHVQ